VKKKGGGLFWHGTLICRELREKWQDGENWVRQNRTGPVEDAEIVLGEGSLLPSSVNTKREGGADAESEERFSRELKP